MTPSIKIISERLYNVLFHEYGEILTSGDYQKTVTTIAKEIRNHMLNANLRKDHYAVEDAMEAINILLHGHGVESVRCKHHVGPYYIDIGLLYVNMGDTYCPTVLFDTMNSRFVIGSWGDFVEARPNRFPY